MYMIKKTVLIVDDDMREAKSMQLRLRGDGVTAHIATSGGAARKLVSAYPGIWEILKPARWNSMPEHPLQNYLRDHVTGYRVKSFDPDLSIRAYPALTCQLIKHDAKPSLAPDSVESRQGLQGDVAILTARPDIGAQIASLLDAVGSRSIVVDSDVDVYQHLVQEHVHAVVADIEDLSLGGLSVLALCKHHNPPVSAYAICRSGGKAMHLSRDLSCSGYFYFIDDRMQQIDNSRGVALKLIHPIHERKQICRSIP